MTLSQVDKNLKLVKKITFFKVKSPYHNVYYTRLRLFSLTLRENDTYPTDSVLRVFLLKVRVFNLI